jgi:hypothetical protein
MLQDLEELVGCHTSGMEREREKIHWNYQKGLSVRLDSCLISYRNCKKSYSSKTFFLQSYDPNGMDMVCFIGIATVYLSSKTPFSEEGPICSQINSLKRK